MLSLWHSSDPENHDCKIGLLRIFTVSSEIVPVEHNFLDSVLAILQSSSPFLLLYLSFACLFSLVKLFLTETHRCIFASVECRENKLFHIMNSAIIVTCI